MCKVFCCVIIRLMYFVLIIEGFIVVVCVGLGWGMFFEKLVVFLFVDGLFVWVCDIYFDVFFYW